MQGGLLEVVVTAPRFEGLEAGIGDEREGEAAPGLDLVDGELETIGRILADGDEFDAFVKRL